MKPRTKTEKEVFALSQKLVPRTSRLERTLQRYKKEKSARYYHIIAEKHREYQVFRYFRIDVHKRKPTTCQEMQQIWYGKGKEIVISRRRTQYAIDSFATYSDMEIRRLGFRYAYSNPSDIGIWTMDIVSLRPEWSRKDLNQIGRLSQISEIQRARALSPYMDTLYNQHHDIFCKLLNSIGGRDMYDCQKEIKVALRHHYTFPKPSIWRDTISLAQQLNIETRNPYYCAPEDVTALHDQLLRRRTKMREKEEIERKIREMKKYENKYYKHIKPFLDLLISNGELVIVPLSSVREIKAEGDMMHHCVFQCEYYKKTDVLLMSAQIDGKHLETIEFSLKEMKILQCRGLQNKYTEHHEEILELLNSNKEQIASRMRKAA